MDPECAQVLLAEASLCDELAESDLAERLAVLGTFDPARIEDAGVPAAEIVRLLCRRLPARQMQPRAVLAETWRIDVFARLLQRGGQAELARIRRQVEPEYEDPLQRMLDAWVLGTETPLEQRDEDELLASLDVWRWATEAVARAGLTGKVSTGPTRDDIESRLGLLEVTRAVRKLVENGCLGRDAELRRLHEYRLATPGLPGLTNEPAMVVYGIGGVGKSTLIARFVMDLYEEAESRPRGAWAYLDLDRPTLSSCEPAVLLADIVRQVATQFPHLRRTLERGQVVREKRMKGAGLEAADTVGSYREQASEFASAMRSIGDGSLVVVLDTYEELEHNQPHQAEHLYGLFSGLSSELPSFRLIVSGRGPASAFINPSRSDRQMSVRPLAEDAALAVLRAFVERDATLASRGQMRIEDDLGAEIIQLVGGIPLTLRLAAKILVQEGAGAIADAADRARALDRVRSEFVRGFLYNRILNHINAQDPRVTGDLRRVAAVSIVPRQVTVEIVERVLLPALDPRPTSSPGQLFSEMASEVAFAEREGDVLRLREDLRGPALAALKLHDHEIVQRVHELAVSFYEAESHDEAQDQLRRRRPRRRVFHREARRRVPADGRRAAAVELAYHRLALGDPAVAVDDATLRKLEASIGDLPPPSAELVQRTLEDSEGLTELLDRQASEREVLAQADAAVRKGDVDSARRLLAQRGSRAEGTELNRVESRLEEDDGNLEAAAAAARRDLDAAAFAADATRFAASAVRLAELEERRGDARGAEAALRRAAEAPLLTGYSELRLELVLKLMNTLERAGLDTEESRWPLELDARAFLQRSDPRSVETSTALLRLLAAAFGREEPERIREAVRQIGFGHEEDPQRVQALVAALADWDSAQPDPGSLARMSGLQVDPDAPNGIEGAWRAGVAGLGTEAGPLLDRLWTSEQPPAAVREAMRSIYVWWGVRAVPHPVEAPAPSSHLDTQTPLDWSQKETRELEEILLTAYPTGTESLALAARAGIDPSQINWAGTGRRITRELTEVASRSGLLDALIESVLVDQSVSSLHDPLRSLVGDDWIKSHNLPTAADSTERPDA
jgi:hypothetical protein